MDALLRRVEESPDELQHRLVYSDYLQEHDPIRGACFDADLDFTKDPTTWGVLGAAITQVDSDWAKRALHHYDVWLLPGRLGRKIQCIKHIRSLTGEGLKEAKERSEAAPVVVCEGLDGAHAEALRIFLERWSEGLFEVRPAGPVTLSMAGARLADVILNAPPPAGIWSELGFEEPAAEDAVVEDVPFIQAVLICERFRSAGADVEVIEAWRRRNSDR